MVRRGEINFWYDNWMGEGTIAETEMVSDARPQVGDILSQTRWDINRLRSLVTVNWVEKILEWKGKLRDGGDIRIWQPKLDGLFSTNSAW